VLEILPNLDRFKSEFSQLPAMQAYVKSDRYSVNDKYMYTVESHFAGNACTGFFVQKSIFSRKSAIMGNFLPV
jgi:hypothetical protein